MCCYDPLGHGWVLSASSQEFPTLKFLIKYRLQGKKKKGSAWELMDSKSAWRISVSWTVSLLFKFVPINYPTLSISISINLLNMGF